jgi:hypothetical protein
MDPQTFALFSSLGELGGLGTLLWFLFRSLRIELASLRKLVGAQERTLEAQRETLVAMERRVDEAEKVGALYRKLIDDLPGDIARYREILRGLKDQVIEELEDANQRKDERLAELTRSRLDEIQKQETVLDEIPELQAKLQATFEKIEGRLSVLDLFQPGTPLGLLLEEMEHVARDRIRAREERVIEVLPFERSFDETAGREAEAA